MMVGTSGSSSGGSGTPGRAGSTSTPRAGWYQAMWSSLAKRRFSSMVQTANAGKKASHGSIAVSSFRRHAADVAEEFVARKTLISLVGGKWSHKSLSRAEEMAVTEMKQAAPRPDAAISTHVSIRTFVWSNAADTMQTGATSTTTRTATPSNPQHGQKAACQSYALSTPALSAFIDKDTTRTKTRKRVISESKEPTALQPSGLSCSSSGGTKWPITKWNT
mmetsp:Transcript_65896/g.183581  ORF Transcript_65896/g.183581 Transcript_65896/m.183581 type:complete len:220 (+) Transcript_65896:873-1532(+)